MPEPSGVGFLFFFASAHMTHGFLSNTLITSSLLMQVLIPIHAPSRSALAIIVGDAE
jgi:hypothetical protein